MIRGKVSIPKAHSRSMIYLLFLCGGPGSTGQSTLPNMESSRDRELALLPPYRLERKRGSLMDPSKGGPHPHPPHGSVWPAAGLACCWGDRLKARIFSAGSRGQMSRFWEQDWLQSCLEKTSLRQAMGESRSRPGPDARLWETPANTLHGPVSQKHSSLSFYHLSPGFSPSSFPPPQSNLMGPTRIIGKRSRFWNSGGLGENNIQIVLNCH